MQIQKLIASIESAVHDHDLVPILRHSIVWAWPRTDLLFWITALNRFDSVLEDVCRSYGLAGGNVQLNEFTPKTKELVLVILNFTTSLLEHATNKKTFNSYDVSAH